MGLHRASFIYKKTRTFLINETFFGFFNLICIWNTTQILYLYECKKTELDYFNIILLLNDRHQKMEKTGYSKRSMNIQILKIIAY